MTPEDKVTGWVILLVFSTIAGMVIGYTLLPYPYEQPPDTVVIVDTVYAPPPGWSEAFRLDCRWIPEK